MSVLRLAMTIVSCTFGIENSLSPMVKVGGARTPAMKLVYQASKLWKRLRETQASSMYCGVSS